MSIFCLQLENIQTFVNFCQAYGVHRVCIFQPPDLYEGRNPQMVISCIQALGTEVSAEEGVMREGGGW